MVVMVETAARLFQTHSLAAAMVLAAAMAATLVMAATLEH
jgi:hypothetical protein